MKSCKLYACFYYVGKPMRISNQAKTLFTGKPDLINRPEDQKTKIRHVHQSINKICW